jgi:hypothetical protein
MFFIFFFFFFLFFLNQGGNKTQRLFIFTADGHKYSDGTIKKEELAAPGFLFFFSLSFSFSFFFFL